MGIVADQMDRPSLARRCYALAYPAFVAAGDVLLLVKTKYNLALLHLRQGQYEEALAHLAQARADLAQLPDIPDAAYVDLFEARVRRALDQTARAQELLKRALTTFEEEGRRIESAETLVELAHLQAKDTTFESLMQAVAHLKRAEDHLREANVPLLVAWAQMEQAEFYLRLECTTEASECAEAARDMFVEADLDLRRAQAEALLADCRWQLQPDQAQAWYRSALNAAGENMPVLAARCRRGLARLDAATGNIDAAETQYERAVTLLESVRRSLRSHSHQAGFLESWQELAKELLAALHARPGGEYNILAWIERLKARALADLLAGQPPDSQADTELTRLLEQRARLRREFDRRETSLRAQIGLQMQEMPQRGPSLAARDVYQAKSLSTARRRLQALEEQIARRHNSAIEWREGAAFDPISVHQLLDEHTALISYYTAGGQLYALTATQAKGDLSVHPLCAGLADVEARWWRTRRLITRATDVQARLSYFWDVLVEPLAKHLQSKTRLLIVPHRGLFHIPFAGLYDTKNERYLVERWTVHLAPSATILEQCRQQTHGTHQPLLAGFSGHPGRPDYLPGVEQEIQALASLFPAADVLLGEQATPESILNTAPGRSFVHLAGHAFYNSLNPLDSGMPLAKGLWLRASDLYLHYGHLNGATIVLSGCSTGRGRPTGGEVLGLTSAFLYAGASGIVTSLWRVDDAATSELMSAFYRRLGEGLDIAKALRQAQLELLQSEQYASPYYWAPFVLSGDSRTPIDAP
jgi:CHAT domain-containing protein